MRRRRLVTLAGLLMLASGCVSDPAMVPATICTGAPATAVQALVGRNVGELRLAPNLDRRIITPSTAVTEDYREGRLNLWVDDKGWISKAECW